MCCKLSLCATAHTTYARDCAGLEINAHLYLRMHAQAEWLARRLTASGFPAVYLAADVAQAERQRLMQEFREFKARVGF